MAGSFILETSGGFDDVGQDQFPTLTTVHCLVETALGVVAVEVAENCHVDDVGISWVHDDTTDVTRIRQAHVLPGFASISTFVNTVAPVRAT